MTKFIITLITLICINLASFSQDLITPANGKDIEARVLDISNLEISYKLKTDLNGPTLTIPKSDVLIIRYADGSHTLFFKQLKNRGTELLADSGNSIAADIVTDIPAAIIKDQTQPEIRQAKESLTPQINLVIEGQQDAKANYMGQNSGALWTAATALVLSPLVGLIPAGACSSKPPKEKNLNILDNELSKNTTYKKAYSKEAHKKKKIRVWVGYLIGSGIWSMFVFS